MPVLGARVLVLAALALAGCGASSPADTGDVGEAGELGDGSTGSAGGTESGESGDPDPTDTESETDTGPACTGEPCSSRLTMSFAHALPLLDGPHRFLITTPIHELICSVEASLDGQKSCFGFAFTDLSWTEQEVVVEMTNPFHDADQNPEATPFAAVGLRIERGGELIYDEPALAVEPGEPLQPDPCGPVCWHASATATIE